MIIKNLSAPENFTSRCLTLCTKFLLKTNMYDILMYCTCIITAEYNDALLTHYYFKKLIS